MGRSFDVLTSSLEVDPAARRRLAASVREHRERLDERTRASLRALIWPDVFSEYDARHLSRFVGALEVELTPRFRECERHWARDEELHYLGFRAAYAALADVPEEAIEADLERRAREVDFGPIAELFADEFSMACLLAYDELATVRAYRSGFPRYAALGPEMLAFVRRVTADEGRHFRNFLKLVRAEHAHRLGELDEVVERIRSFEGTPYRNTFVLDHDDDVWSEEIFDEAAGLVRRRLAFGRG